jgi:hypothetical protein
MEDHETRRKIIREWMALPKDKRHTEEQVVAFAKKATQQNQFHRSRRDPDHKFRRDPTRKSWDGSYLALASRDERHGGVWIRQPSSSSRRCRGARALISVL